MLIGQDRVGKTSLRRYLRGEAFKEKEASTNGIEMISPVKNAGKEAWKNPAPLENTSALDHKCAELVEKDLLGSSEEPTSGKGATQERSNDDLVSNEVINRNGKAKLIIALTIYSFFTDSGYMLTSREVIRG